MFLDVWPIKQLIQKASSLLWHFSCVKMSYKNAWGFLQERLVIKVVQLLMLLSSFLRQPWKLSGKLLEILNAVGYSYLSKRFYRNCVSMKNTFSMWRWDTNLEKLNTVIMLIICSSLSRVSSCKGSHLVFALGFHSAKCVINFCFPKILWDLFMDWDKVYVQIKEKKIFTKRE